MSTVKVTFVQATFVHISNITVRFVQEHMSWHHLSMSGISQLLLNKSTPKFKGEVLLPSLTKDNPQGDICPGNICPSNTCQYQQYLSCYWPDFYLQYWIDSLAQLVSPSVALPAELVQGKKLICMSFTCFTRYNSSRNISEFRLFSNALYLHTYILTYLHTFTYLYILTYFHIILYFISWSRNLLISTICWSRNILSKPNVTQLNSKIFSDPKCSWTQILKSKIFLNPKFFLPQNFLGPKLFWPKIFSESKIVWTQKLSKIF